MNYLAHFYLADTHPDSVIGSLLGDFVKGRLDPSLAPELRLGIQTHRKVDSYTDQHPDVLVSKRRLDPQRRRYAGIIIDICYDHFLAVHWTRFSEQELAAFSQQIYGVLQMNWTYLPTKARGVVQRMINQDWLGSYQYTHLIARALDNIAARLRRGIALQGAGIELMENYEGLERDFLSFFPDLVATVQAYKQAAQRAPATFGNYAGHPC